MAAPDDPTKNPKAGRRPGRKPASRSDDGSAAWQRLTEQTTPLDPAQKNRLRRTAETPPRRRAEPQAPKPKAPPAGLRPPRPAAVQRAALPPQAEIPHKAKRRLARGGLEIGARIDLHGMTAAEARLALEHFLVRARSERLLWVLVITGKGMAGRGVLRRNLPQWLAEPALAAHVVEFAAAAPQHGGGGAFYLRLRRPPA